MIGRGHRGRVDSNQPEIVKALRQIGCSVQQTSVVGQGFPDLVVGFQGRNFLMEIKGGKGDLTPAEQKFHKEWRGDVVVINSVDDALWFVERFSEWH